MAAFVIGCLATTLLVWLGIRRMLTFVKVVGTSMAPTYRPGERVLALRVRWWLRPGRPVVFAAPASPLPGPDGVARSGRPGQLLLKRVAFVAGSHLPPSLRSQLRTSLPEQVPPGHVFVAGDAESSVDSRSFGYVPRSSIYGIVLRPRPAADPARRPTPAIEGPEPTTI